MVLSNPHLVFWNGNAVVFGELNAGALGANWHWVILILQWWSRTNYPLGTSQGECLLTQFTKEVRMCICLGKLLSKSWCSFETVVWLNTKKKQSDTCLRRPWQGSEWRNYKFLLSSPLRAELSIFGFLFSASERKWMKFANHVWTKCSESGCASYVEPN